MTQHLRSTLDKDALVLFATVLHPPLCGIFPTYSGIPHWELILAGGWFLIIEDDNSSIDPI